MNKLLNISPSPHVAGEYSVKKIMYGVIIALIPAWIASVYFFGIGAIAVSLTAIISCVVFEYLFQKFILKSEAKISDGSAILTGLLLAFNVPSNLPLWIIIIGAFVSIVIAKLSFGGLGQNVFNPALVGRVFLLISFPAQMTSWPKAIESRWINWITNRTSENIDAFTGATPLSYMKQGALDKLPEQMQLFYGQMGGSMGEVCALALLLGFIFMLYKKIITWHIPVFTIGTIFIFSGILHLVDPTKFASPIFHILTGGAMLGAIFMATDMVTSPMTYKGMAIFSVGIAVITVLIRSFGAYPEGVSFAIIIMNGFVPLIDKYVKPNLFGEEVKNG